MARIDNRALFFTTSPRTPSKMIPEIKLLHEVFSGEIWNNDSQINFIEELVKTDFFEGSGSSSDKAFSARDRITRAPKALGFVDLKPTIALTDAGHCLVYGKRPQEAFLRQLLKFQLPSPYHKEASAIDGTFFIRPYLEIIRLINRLGKLTFDEFKIFAVQLTDYRKFDSIVNDIVEFRHNKERHKGEYKRFSDEVWTEAVLKIYSDDIKSGDTKTRETNDSSLKTFIKTKKSNFRDYADACFRYLRYTGLVAISHKGRSLSIYPDKLQEVEYILKTVDRNPVFINNENQYKQHLFNSSTPQLLVDIKENIIDLLMRIHTFTKRELIDKSVEELKDIRDEIIQKRQEAAINAQVADLKSYALYSEIIDTFNEIISDELYDAPLMFEWNTWRAMTMLNGGNIKGNFKIDDAGAPMSTAQGNMPDIECDYGDFMLSVEVTLQSGQRQHEAEGESVPRHYGQLKKRSGKDTFCLFIAPTINKSISAYFFGLNRISIDHYGGKSQIVPLELSQFMKLVENSYSFDGHPKPHNVKEFLTNTIQQVENSSSEAEWMQCIQECVDNWLVA